MHAPPPLGAFSTQAVRRSLACAPPDGQPGGNGQTAEQAQSLPWRGGGHVTCVWCCCEGPQRSGRGPSRTWEGAGVPDWGLEERRPRRLPRAAGSCDSSPGHIGAIAPRFWLGSQKEARPTLQIQFLSGKRQKAAVGFCTPSRGRQDQGAQEAPEEMQAAHPWCVPGASPLC